MYPHATADSADRSLRLDAEDEAVSHFCWVAERGAKNYLEYGLAKNELNRLKYRPKVSTTN